MTASATRSVPLDWQGPVGTYSAARRIAAAVARQPGVQQASPLATAPFASIVHQAAVGTIRSGSGAVLAVPPGYLEHIRTFRFLRGGLRPGEIVFDQQLAATLQVEPGDTVKFKPRAGARPHRFRVSGVALVTAPDVLFQPLNPALGPAPAQPPADIAILPLATFARTLAPALPTLAAGGGTTAAVPGAVRGTQWQVQAQVDPRALGGSPAHALRRADQVRNAVERSLPGQVVFMDNLSDSLNSAAGDALYAETLYIMLAVPGALVALALAYLAALGTAERDRRDLALLRARGASRRSLLFLAAVESAVLGLLAGVLGTGAALLSVRLVSPGGATGTARVLVAFAVCFAFGFAGAAAARIAAGIGVLRESVSEGRRGGRRHGRPLWQRLYIDLLCLAGSGLVYWLTLRTGFSAVINPD
jgi:putative ABC transport system permease protein